MLEFTSYVALTPESRWEASESDLVATSIVLIRSLHRNAIPFIPPLKTCYAQGQISLLF